MKRTLFAYCLLVFSSIFSVADASNEGIAHGDQIDLRPDIDKCIIAESSLCGVQTYKQDTSKNCPPAKFKLGSGPICGIASFKTDRSPACGVESYKVANSRACGVEIPFKNNYVQVEARPDLAKYCNQRVINGQDSQQSCRDREMGEACEKAGLAYVNKTYAQRIYGETEWHSVLTGPVEKNLVYCFKWRSCVDISHGALRHHECSDPSHGITYASCRGEIFGVDTYEECRHPSHGVEQYNSCNIRVDETGVCTSD